MAREKADGHPSVETERFAREASTLPTTVSGAHTGSKEDIFDTQTIITDNESLHLPENTKEHLIEAFATEILQQLGDEYSGTRAVRLLKALPDILKDFSQELSRQSLLGIQKNAATFVRHYRQ
ncbi:hypothetical protein D0Z07_0864 [Hyphodiscus hymeniophilus]|uniref:Uncharacterized protein n=1 Tax=Hyphodiscus hymeniophilus TaxID=353542 RepID=A0A9P6VNW8_9HELO|nr:hypothetical protein D0Z07_0864 [Hyphodiscus hymeniophilus]